MTPPSTGPLPTRAVLAAAEPACFASTPCARHTAGLPGDCADSLSLEEVRGIAEEAADVLGRCGGAAGVLVTLRRVRVLAMQLGRVLSAGSADVEAWRAMAAERTDKAAGPLTVVAIKVALGLACDAIVAARAEAADAAEDRDDFDTLAASLRARAEKAEAELADVRAELRDYQARQRGCL